MVDRKPEQEAMDTTGGPGELQACLERALQLADELQFHLVGAHVNEALIAAQRLNDSQRSR